MIHKKKILTYGMLAFGSLVALLGAAFVAMYVREAIIARAGEPDQSLLFWYLPILFLGVIAVLTGLGIGAWGFSLARRMSRKHERHDGHFGSDGG